MEINKIYNEDCMSTMARMKEKGIKVDLIITSPPYNKNAHASAKGDNTSWRNMRGRQIAYDVYGDDMPQDEYEEWQTNVIQSCLDILKPNGSLFYNHKDIAVKGKIIPPKWVYKFDIHQQIIWDRGSSVANDPHYFQPITEYVYWIVKDTKNFYFDKTKSIFRSNVWRINPESNPHPAPFPSLLVGNIINSCSVQGNLIYDPFMGSGTTAICAIRNKCDYIGSEISQKYIDIAQERIKIETSQLSLF